MDSDVRLGPGTEGEFGGQPIHSIDTLLAPEVHMLLFPLLSLMNSSKTPVTSHRKIWGQKPYPGSILSCPWETGLPFLFWKRLQSQGDLPEFWR